MKLRIENYENMTPEEKVAAYEAYEPDMSGYVPKSQFDKAASEAASYKKQLRERQSDEEAKAAREAVRCAAWGKFFSRFVLFLGEFINPCSFLIKRLISGQ